jgi:glycosyltransferase involved in cell wall biosynthesis
MNELVSIIIPVYNRASIMPETLESIISQTYKNFECILVDDWSTDNSVEVAKSFVERDSRFKLFSRPKSFKKGACSCRNFGFEKSTGVYIQWFDSDDLMLSNMIEDKVKILSDNYFDAVIMRHAYFKTGSKDYIVDKRSTIKNQTNNPAFEIISSDFTSLTDQIMFKKDFLNKQKKLFNINLEKNQETELFIRLFLNEPKLCFLENLGILVRIGDKSMTSSFQELKEDRKLLINIIAYFEIYNSFKKKNRISNEIKLFFNNYFYNCLRKMETNRFIYLKLFLLGLHNNWFPSGFIKYKMFIKRYFSNSN